MIFKINPVSGCIRSAARHAHNIAKACPEHGFILVFNGIHVHVDEHIVENYHAQLEQAVSSPVPQERHGQVSR